MKLKLDKETQQINLFDRRYYTIKGTDEYYPSATTVLGMYPKGPNFEQWLRDNGNSTHSILKKAGDDGTALHNAVEDALHGKELRMINDFGQENFPLIVWKMLCRFQEFAPNIKRVIEVEGNSISKKLRVGGTRDLICEMHDGLVYLVDHKSSNNKQPTWPIQLAVYAEMAKELGIHIDRIAILWLKAKTRGPAKNKTQGKGWQLIDYTDQWDEALETFGHLRALFDIANPRYIPHNITMPNVIKLDLDPPEVEVAEDPFGDDPVEDIRVNQTKEASDIQVKFFDIVTEKVIENEEEKFRKGTPVYMAGEKCYVSIREAASRLGMTSSKLSKMLHGKIENTSFLHL